MIKNANSPNTNRTGASAFFQSPTCRSRRARTSAANTSSASFAISDGCSRQVLYPIHRREPSTQMPIPG
jgi:hypothetical protein